MAKKRTDCNCLKEANESLKQHGIRLKEEQFINFKTGKCFTCGPLLMTEKIDSKDRKAKLRTIICSYCPMCGKKKTDI